MRECNVCQGENFATRTSYHGSMYSRRALHRIKLPSKQPAACYITDHPGFPCGMLRAPLYYRPRGAFPTSSASSPTLVNSSSRVSIRCWSGTADFVLEILYRWIVFNLKKRRLCSILCQIGENHLS